MRGVDDTLGEVVEVFDDRQIRQHGLCRAPGGVADPVDDPEQAEEAVVTE